MRTLTIIRILIVLFPFYINGQVDLISLFERSSLHESACDSLIIACAEEKNEKETAYLGAALMLKSKYLNSKHKKFSYFKKGKEKLEHIIGKYPNFVEIRWIRYCIQVNCPRFLGYNKHIEVDKKILEKHGTYDQLMIIKND